MKIDLLIAMMAVSVPTICHSFPLSTSLSQAMGSIKGVVECLESCHVGSEEDPMRVIVTSTVKSERVVSLQVVETDDPKRSLFQVSNGDQTN